MKTKILLHQDGAAQAAKETVYASVKEAILSGTLKQGSPLPERYLAEHYHLSRTPVREILQRLQYEGLVELLPNRGAFVCQFTAEELIDIFFAREAVEGMAARLSATRHHEGRLRPIQEAFAKLQVEDRPEALARMVQAGLRLHDFVVDAARNVFLRRAYDALRNQAMLVRSITQRSFTIEQASFRDHLRILDTIRQRQERAAEAAMRDHLRSTRERMLRQMFR